MRTLLQIGVAAATLFAASAAFAQTATRSGSRERAAAKQQTRIGGVARPQGGVKEITVRMSGPAGSRPTIETRRMSSRILEILSVNATGNVTLQAKGQGTNQLVLVGYFNGEAGRWGSSTVTINVLLE